MTVGCLKEWREHISEPHRYWDCDVITGCMAHEIRMVHHTVLDGESIGGMQLVEGAVAG